MTDSIRSPFHKEAFDKTSAKRRDTLLNEAINEFASKGYAGTNINIIAKNAGISIGAMYSYFASKEDLFLTIVSKQFDVLQQVLEQIDADKPLFDIVRQLFVLTMRSSLAYPELSQIYLDVTTEANTSLSEKLSSQFEVGVVDFLLAKIERAKQLGEINPSSDSRILAFCIDNLLTMFQFSFSSSYYRQRMAMYLGSEALDYDQVIDAMLRIIKNQVNFA